MPLIKLPPHEHACGDVTQQCPRCEQPVPRRLMAEHPTSEACRFQCMQCQEEVPSTDIITHTKER